MIVDTHNIPTEFEFEPGFDHTQVNALTSNPTFLSPTFSGPAAPVATQTPRLSYLQATPAPSISTAISTGSDAARDPSKVAFWKDSSRHGFDSGQLTKITKTGVLIYVGHMDGFQDVGTADTVFELTGGRAVGSKSIRFIHALQCTNISQSSRILPSSRVPPPASSQKSLIGGQPI
jgi:hypothetical protein